MENIQKVFQEYINSPEFAEKLTELCKITINIAEDMNVYIRAKPEVNTTWITRNPPGDRNKHDYYLWYCSQNDHKPTYEDFCDEIKKYF